MAGSGERGSGEAAMSDAAAYTEIDRLRDGRRIEIRAFRPDDKDALEAAVARASPLSLYRRFFTIKRAFTERERAFFLNVDFVNHVALVAVIDETGRPAIVGACRYVVVTPGRAEVAFAVIDQYQRQGVGAALMRHLIVVARAAGLRELIADVLTENAPMLKVFERCGLPIRTTREPEVVQVILRLT
jgi:RimJ/RimL family protein N-acetyltransferase